jgi:hypothetical protein
MNKVTKYTLLFLLLWPYLVMSIFDMLFGILSLAMSAIRTPFKTAGEWVVKQADKINYK